MKPDMHPPRPESYHNNATTSTPAAGTTTNTASGAAAPFATPAKRSATSTTSLTSLQSLDSAQGGRSAQKAYHTRSAAKALQQAEERLSEEYDSASTFSESDSGGNLLVDAASEADALLAAHKQGAQLSFLLEFKL